LTHEDWLLGLLKLTKTLSHFSHARLCSASQARHVVF